MHKKSLIISFFTIIFIVSLARCSSSEAAQDIDGGGAQGRQFRGSKESTSGDGPRNLIGRTILVVGKSTDMYYAAAAQETLSSLGASATLVDETALTAPLLDGYDVVWIALGVARTVYLAGKADIVKSYIHDGGGLIVEQPNEVGWVPVLPYDFHVADSWYSAECQHNVLQPSHEIVEGLSDYQLLHCYDTVDIIGAEWEVLVQDGDGDPSLSVATYGDGRVIIELGVTFPDPICHCITGSDDICMADIMIERMVDWVADTDRLKLLSPENGTSLATAPTFAWNPGPYDAFKFYSGFCYAGYGYYTVQFWLLANSLPMASSWWESLYPGYACYWAVLGVDTTTYDWEVAGPWAFTKE